MNKIKLLIIYILVIGIVGVTYCAFSVSVEKNGSIQSTELSATFLNNADLLAKVQVLDSTITTIDKTTDLNRVTTLPTINFTSDNVVSLDTSNVPIYLWIDNGTINYFSAAVNIDLNNN